MMLNANGLAPSENARGPGRPTLDDTTLKNNRDTLVEIFSSWWAEVGWLLPRAKSRIELRDALEPLRPHGSKHLFSRLLLPSSDAADAKQIRHQRKNYESVMRSLYEAQEKEIKYRAWAGEAELALVQAPEDKREVVKAKITERKAQLQIIINEHEAARRAQQSFEQKLAEMEAAFAQDELLKFILKRFINGGYSRDPLNLANATAGLPYTQGVRFIGAWESYLRCSKLPCSTWPHFRYELFKTIESFWLNSLSSDLTPVEFFKQEILALPKTIFQNLPEPKARTAKRERCENILRAYLVKHWNALRLAIIKTCESCPIEPPERAPYVLVTNLGKFQAAPKAAIDNVIEPPEVIED